MTNEETKETLRKYITNRKMGLNLDTSAALAYYWLKVNFGLRNIPPKRIIAEWVAEINKTVVDAAMKEIVEAFPND